MSEKITIPEATVDVTMHESDTTKSGVARSPLSTTVRSRIVRTGVNNRRSPLVLTVTAVEGKLISATTMAALIKLADAALAQFRACP